MTVHGDSRTATISVLLPAWNETETLARCLDSLRAIGDSHLEVILCAGGDDDTLAIARQYESDSIMVLEQKRGEGKQRALRRCFEHSTGDVLYLTDADCVVPSSVFQEVVDPVLTGQATAATGTCRPLDEQVDQPIPLLQWSILRAVDRSRGPFSNGLLGRNCALTRSALLRAGAFNHVVPIGTDYHLAKSLLANGDQIRFVPAAVLTRFPTNPRDMLHQQSRWIRNIFIHAPGFHDTDELLASARTVGLGITILLWPLSWIWTRRTGVAAWMVIFSILVVKRLSYARSLTEENGRTLPGRYFACLPALTLLDILSWAWPAVDIISSRRRLRW